MTIAAYQVGWGHGRAPRRGRRGACPPRTPDNSLFMWKGLDRLAETKAQAAQASIGTT